MFRWFTKWSDRSATGMHKIRLDFSEMLEAARLAFTLATDTCLAGVDTETVREKLLATDKEINQAERDIRKALVLHMSVENTLGGAADFPECLVMMSIVKDAERLGDYAKNIFDLAVVSPLQAEAGDDRERMLVLKKIIDQLFTSCRQVIDKSDADAALKRIRESTWISRQCEQNVVRLLRMENPGRLNAYYVLLYRYMKRIASHLRNICSSVVQPVHKIDFTSKFTRGMDKDGDLLDRKLDVLSED